MGTACRRSRIEVRAVSDCTTRWRTRSTSRGLAAPFSLAFWMRVSSSRTIVRSCSPSSTRRRAFVSSMSSCSRFVEISLRVRSALSY